MIIHPSTRYGDPFEDYFRNYEGLRLKAPTPSQPITVSDHDGFRRGDYFTFSGTIPEYTSPPLSADNIPVSFRSNRSGYSATIPNTSYLSAAAPLHGDLESAGPRSRRSHSGIRADNCPECAAQGVLQHDNP